MKSIWHDEEATKYFRDLFKQERDQYKQLCKMQQKQAKKVQKWKDLKAWGYDVIS